MILLNVDDGDNIKLCEYQALASERPSPQYRRVGWPGSPGKHDDADVVAADDDT